MKSRLLILLLLFLLPLGAMAQQALETDFESWNYNPNWKNVYIRTDSTAHSGTHVCLCDTLQEFGFGFQFNNEYLLQKQNVRIEYEAWHKIVLNQGEVSIAVNITDSEGKNRYWQSYALSTPVNDSSEWFKTNLDLWFPFDHLDGATIKAYLWNPNHCVVLIDDARVSINAAPLGCFLPVDTLISPEGQAKAILLNDKCSILYQPENGHLMLADGKKEALSHPIYLVNAFVNDAMPFDNPIEHFETDWKQVGDNQWMTGNPETGVQTTLTINAKNGSELVFDLKSHFEQGQKLLRQALVIPFVDSTMKIYRKNQLVDTADFQNDYYLDREGFIIGQGERSIATYHNTGISSLQFNTRNQTAYFNTDFWRDHPLIHYPLDNDTSNYYQDISYKNVGPDASLYGSFTLFVGSAPVELPRIMPMWDGFESAFIITEHADWTDLRTHRAVLFGRENITHAEDAVGGFVYYGIPVTKSVFYSNPDQVNNDALTHGAFKGLHATITGDKEFLRLLKQLRKLGFEICLHTPEQYTSVNGNLKKSLGFMRHHFGSPTWIDHGYNNGARNNREDLVCDALLPDSPQYAAELWKKNGVKYLWNAYYEEAHDDRLNFDGNFIQPYDGFGDGIANRQITTLPDGGDFLLWATSSTLEVNEDREWYFYFSPARLQRLIDNHNVFITHTYPAWANPYRAFWKYDEDSLAVAMPGFNYALQQLDSLRNEKKILPTTIQDYLSFYEGLLDVAYVILDDGNIMLKNNGNKIEGLTLLCKNPVYIDGKPIRFRKVGDEYLVWFDLNRKEKVKIIIQRD